MTDSAQFKPGDIVGGSYQILDHIGSGAMGMIYKARHVSMPAIYAVKILPTDQLDEIAVLRFQNEAQAIAKLNHPNIISIYNFALHAGTLPFYVMELLEGENLEQKLAEQGPMPLETVLPLFIEVCAGLNYAHRKGILHRDIKPANFVILDQVDVRGARVKVVDFGMVKFAEQIKPELQKLTFEGEVCGSPSYMSPEQSSGEKLDPRSDIYSLGCSLYQAITGKLAFIGSSNTETMMMHHEVAAPSLASKSDSKTYSEYLELLVAKMLAKEKMNRYQTMESVAQDLRNIMDGKPLGTLSPIMASLAIAPDKIEIDTFPIPDTANRSSETDTAGGAMMPRQPQAKHSDGKSHSNSTSNRSNRNNKESENRSQTSAKTAKLVVILMISAGLVATSIFLAWKPSRNVKQTAHTVSVQSTAAAVAGVSPDTARSSEQKGPNLIAPDGPTGLETDAPVLTQARYFSQKVSVDGKDYLEFDFPRPTKGYPLAWIGSSLIDSHRAEGKIRFPREAKLYLMPLPATVDVPHFFEKFKQGEITGICIAPPNASDELLKCVTIPGISQVLLGHCTSLTAKIIPSLQKLNLTVLDLNSSQIDGAALAQLHYWQELTLLNVGHCKNVTPILKQLSGSKKMIVLDVAGDQLNAADYQLLSQLPNLKVLNLSGNKIDTEDLHGLSRLSNLKGLIAIYTRFADDSTLEELKHFPALRELTVLRGYLRTKSLQLLKQECPNLKVAEKTLAEVMIMAGANQPGKWGE